MDEKAIKTKVAFEGGKLKILINDVELVAVDAIALAELGVSLTPTPIDNAVLGTVKGALAAASFSKEL